MMVNSKARTRVIATPLKLFNNDGSFLVFAPGKKGYREHTGSRLVSQRPYALALVWGCRLTTAI
jgi:hypothetical protein